MLAGSTVTGAIRAMDRIGADASPVRTSAPIASVPRDDN